MMKILRKAILTAVMMGIGLLGVAPTAKAEFTYRISAPSQLTGSPIIGGDPDGSESIEVVGFSTLPAGFSGGFTFTSQPLFPGTIPGETTIDTAGSVGYDGTTPNTITIELTRTNFSLGQDGPGALITDLSITVITNATVTVQSFVNYGTGGNDAFNGAGIGGELPTTQAVGVANPTGGGLVSTYGQEMFTASPVNSTKVLEGAVPTSAFADDFSVTQLITITFNGPGATISFDYKTTVQNPAPPALVLLLAGSPVLGFGAWLRRRRKPVSA